ncbi:MAG TPA: hypothetical protein VNA26_03750 [Chitinophagaceae bacterium]|nr:hypothetical protein [Chitinophagaceae bacterium]
MKYNLKRPYRHCKELRGTKQSNLLHNQVDFDAEIASQSSQ